MLWRQKIDNDLSNFEVSMVTFILLVHISETLQAVLKTIFSPILANLICITESKKKSKQVIDQWPQGLRNESMDFDSLG